MTVKQRVNRTLSVTVSFAASGALMALGWWGDSQYAPVAAALGSVWFICTIVYVLFVTFPGPDPWPDSVPVEQIERKRAQMRATLRQARAKDKEAA